MKKKDLLKHLPSEWPECNMAKIIRTPGRKALMVLLPGWQIVGHTDEKCVVHFVWNEGYLTYYPESQIWDSRKYESLYYNAYVSGGSFDEKSIKAIGNFTQNHQNYYPGSIEGYEREISYSKQEKAEGRKQRRIDDFMKDCPPLPKDFKRWCEAKLKGSRCKKVNIKLFQPYKDGTMERIFTVEECCYSGMTFMVTEICRSAQHEYGGTWRWWYYGVYKGRYGRNQHFWDKKNQSIVNNLPKSHYLYDNLDELDMTASQRAVLRALDGRVDPSMALRRLETCPELEYVLKRGLIRLGVDIVEFRCGKEVSTLSKATCNRLKEIDGGWYSARLIELAPRINEKYLKDFNKIQSDAKADKIIALAGEYNINHVYRLLMETGGVTIPVINKYNDYLRMSAQLGNNPHDEIIYRNRRWEEWHDRYAEEINGRKEKKENRKYAAIRKDYRLNKSLFAWEDGGYLIMVPKSAADICTEGRKQHHCVGASTIYRQNMAERKSFIVFLRKATEPEKPYYTIECDLTKVLQFYSAYDRQPDKEKVEKILSKWMKQVRKNVKKMQEAAV